ncbi:30S ribosomal protein S6 [Orenia metallireducens]|jgi:small subunit ribosomal protein S6|uniref:Small ribosomal subunit protein bS6 n=1 Tax=Orenia metallireducens TaxID=1413210 RepID=A0A1C0ACW2_9FIRM|nr:30S ribosomal protein S6 [Orenia metallireducens]OCL28463.1 30S ribosomal protein S6 [Orenia metallireducens]
MRKYETMFIIKSNLGEEATEAVIEKMTGVIANNGGEVANVDKMGTKELAYEINKDKTGYYVLVNFAGEPATVEELERIYKIDDNVLRYLILRDE